MLNHTTSIERTDTGIRILFSMLFLLNNVPNCMQMKKCLIEKKFNHPKQSQMIT